MPQKHKIEEGAISRTIVRGALLKRVAEPYSWLETAELLLETMSQLLVT